MRKDMFKVIVERPRRGGNKTNTERREANMDLEDLPSKQSMRRKHRERKELNENLKPLERFFKSRVGQNWDKVYSEVCEFIDVHSTVQQHVRQHIKDLVHLNVARDTEGKILDKRYSWGGEFHEIWHGDLYIDPDTNILRRYKSKHRRTRWSNPTPEQTLVTALKKMDLFLHEGILYKIERSKPRSLKYDVERENYVKANGTHAAQDMHLNPGGVAVLLSAHFLAGDYFETAFDILQAQRARKECEKAALERKKMEAALQSNDSI